MILCLFVPDMPAYAKETAKNTTEISLTATSLELEPGESGTLMLSGASKGVKWSSSKKSVATVKKGVVTAKKEGKATITATHKGKKYKCTVNVARKRLLITTNEIICFTDTDVLVQLKDMKKNEKLTAVADDPEIVAAEVEVYNTGYGYVRITPQKTGTTTLTIKSNKSCNTQKLKVISVDEVYSGKDKEKKAKKLYETCSKSVVQMDVKDWYGDSVTGTGFYIAENIVVTNYHVIENATSILINGTRAKAVIGYDDLLDIAILESEVPGTPLPLNTHGLTVGETVYAIGSSLGFTGSFSSGMISQVMPFDYGGLVIHSTAPVSAGNSGGPLINAYGEVVGINTYTYTQGQNVNASLEINQIYCIDTFEPVTDYEFKVAPWKTVKEDGTTEYRIGQTNLMSISIPSEMTGYTYWMPSDAEEWNEPHADEAIKTLNNSSVIVFATDNKGTKNVKVEAAVTGVNYAEYTNEQFENVYQTYNLIFSYISGTICTKGKNKLGRYIQTVMDTEDEESRLLSYARTYFIDGMLIEVSCSITAGPEVDKNAFIAEGEKIADSLRYNTQ